MNPGELEVLVALIRSVNPRTVVEFGCNIGRTAKVILRENPSIAAYVGVDVFQGYNFSCEVQKHETPENPGYLATPDYRFQLMLSERGTLDLTKDDLPMCDVVFIDGDHSYKAVDHDTTLAGEIIRPGGMIIWHDYHTIPTVDVRKVLETRQAQGVKIQYVQDTWLAFYKDPRSSVRQ